MARADDFIKDGIFKDMVPEFIDRTTKTYHGECDGLHKALQTLKADAAMYAQGKWPKPLQHRSGQQFKKEMKDDFDAAKSRLTTSRPWKTSSAKPMQQNSGLL